MKNDLQPKEQRGFSDDVRLVRRLLGYLASHRKQFAVSVLVLMAISLLQLAGPYLLKIAIDDYIMAGNYAGVDLIALVYVGVLLLTFLLQYLHIYIMQWAGQSKMRDLRLELFAHLQQQPFSFFDRQQSGNLLTLLVNDVEALNRLLSQGIVMAIADIITICGIVGILFWLDWRLALTGMAVLPGLLYAAALYRRNAWSVYRQVRESVDALNSYLQENIAGMTTVQLFNRQRENAQQFQAINRQYKEQQVRSIGIAAAYFPATEFLYACSIGLILWYGGGKTLQGVLQLGTLVAFIQYFQRFFTPLLELINKYDMIQHALASLERIFRFLDMPTETAERVQPVPSDEIAGAVEFQDVWLSYKEEGESILKGISFRLEPGESLGIVGATGAGKTSIINLLSRFYEIQHGKILIDGRDIRNMSKSLLRRQIAVVLQEPILFEGDIEDNIRLGDRNIGREKIVEAAQRLNAHAFISQLPHGYQEKVHNRGSNLSTGQKQLLALARALVFEPKILVLDEATSSMDAKSEALVRDAVHKVAQQRTAIIIAHRLSTVRNATRIIVVDKGRIVEQGNHDSLLAQRGSYYELYRLQTRDPLINSHHAAK